MTVELTIIAMLAITAGASIYVAWPLLMGNTSAEEYLGTKAEESMLQRLTSQRDNTYAAMKELEFELAMGNLSQEDFQPVYDRYKRRAVALLKRMDDVREGRTSSKEVLADIGDERSWPEMVRSAAPSAPAAAESDLDIEQEIESFRSSRSRSREDAAPASAPAAKCSACGRPSPDPEAAFCGKCGAPLKKGKQRGSTAEAPAERRRGPGGRR
jgi:hypothetical protein